MVKINPNCQLKFTTIDQLGKDVFGSRGKYMQRYSVTVFDTWSLQEEK